MIQFDSNYRVESNFSDAGMVSLGKFRTLKITKNSQKHSKSLQLFESNRFLTDPTFVYLTPPYSWSQIKLIEFELIFIKFFEYFLPFGINRIANFQIKANEFRTNFNLTPPLIVIQCALDHPSWKLILSGKLNMIKIFLFTW